jgi:hypothetical protein
MVRRGYLRRVSPLLQELAPNVVITRKENAMWDTAQTSNHQLSHDMPCPSCGHAMHTFLACSDTCECERAAVRGLLLV